VRRAAREISGVNISERQRDLRVLHKPAGGIGDGALNAGLELRGDTMGHEEQD